MSTKDELGRRLVELYGGATITSTRKDGQYVIRLGYPSVDAGDENVLARHPKLREALKIAIKEAEGGQAHS